MITYRKNCDCSGTASGPRIAVQQSVDRDKVTVIAKEALKACDVCNAPWVEVNIPFVNTAAKETTTPGVYEFTFTPIVEKSEDRL